MGWYRHSVLGWALMIAYPEILSSSKMAINTTHCDKNLPWLESGAAQICGININFRRGFEILTIWENNFSRFSLGPKSSLVIRVSNIYSTGHEFPLWSRPQVQSREQPICFYKLNVFNPMQRESLSSSVLAVIGLNCQPQWRLLATCRVLLATRHAQESWGFLTCALHQKPVSPESRVSQRYAALAEAQYTPVDS